MRRSANAESRPETGPIATAFIGTLSAEASAGGQLLPQREATLSLGTAGRVEQVLVQVGDKVQAGDILLQLESDALQRSVRTAEQNLAIQEANLADLLKGASEQDLLAAEAAVASAKAQLDDLLAEPSPVDILAAEAAVASAQAQLNDLLAGPSEADLARARAALASALAVEKAEQERYAALDTQITVARQELDLATVSLESAQYFYNALANDWQHAEYAPFSPEADVLADAQKAYNVALARYNLSVANINDSAYRAAQAQVAQARANLTALTEEKTVEIASAREQLTTAQTNLSLLTEEKTVQIASAREQLARAQAALSNLVDGVSAEQLTIARAQVAQARISLDNVRARLADATLLAPFDGVVTAVYVSVGEWASGPVIDLVDPASLEVVLDVDEIDIGDIAVGQRTIVTLETWPDQKLEGEVTAIAPKGNLTAEIVTYQVHIRLFAGDLPIRAGMTANADLITAQRENVLLVPNRAITIDRDADKYYVYQMKGEEVIKTEIAVGLRDSSHTEVTGGLQEGDQVIIDYERQGLLFGPGHGGMMGQ